MVHCLVLHARIGPLLHDFLPDLLDIDVVADAVARIRWLSGNSRAGLRLRGAAKQNADHTEQAESDKRRGPSCESRHRLPSSAVTLPISPGRRYTAGHRAHDWWTWDAIRGRPSHTRVAVSSRDPQNSSTTPTREDHSRQRVLRGRSPHR